MFCEIACRVGGLRIIDAYGLSFGVNLYEAGLKGQAGRSNEVEFRESGERIGMATFVPQQGVLRSIPSSWARPGASRPFSATANMIWISLRVVNGMQ